MNIGEKEKREIIIEPIEEPKWIEQPVAPAKVPEPRKEPVPA